MEWTDLTAKNFNRLYESFSFARLVEAHETEGHFPPLTWRQACAAYGRKSIEAWQAEGRVRPVRRGRRLLFRVSELVKCHENDRALILCAETKLDADDRKLQNRN